MSETVKALETIVKTNTKVAIFDLAILVIIGLVFYLLLAKRNKLINFYYFFSSIILTGSTILMPGKSIFYEKTSSLPSNLSTSELETVNLVEPLRLNPYFSPFSFRETRPESRFTLIHLILDLVFFFILAIIIYWVVSKIVKDENRQRKSYWITVIVLAIIFLLLGFWYTQTERLYV